MQWCVMRLRTLVPLCLSIFFAAIASGETDGLSMAAAVDRLEVAHRVEYFLNTPNLVNVFRCGRTHRVFQMKGKVPPPPVLIKRPPRRVNLFSSSHCLQLIVAPSCFFFFKSAGFSERLAAAPRALRLLPGFCLQIKSDRSPLALWDVAEKVSRREEGDKLLSLKQRKEDQNRATAGGSGENFRERRNSHGC